MCNPANKQTSADENITSLVKVINLFIDLLCSGSGHHNVVDVVHRCTTYGPWATGSSRQTGTCTPELGVFATKFCNSNGELGRLVDCF